MLKVKFKIKKIQSRAKLNTRMNNSRNGKLNMMNKLWKLKNKWKMKINNTMKELRSLNKNTKNNRKNYNYWRKPKWKKGISNKLQNMLKHRPNKWFKSTFQTLAIWNKLCINSKCQCNSNHNRYSSTKRLINNRNLFLILMHLMLIIINKSLILFNLCL